ncbi:MAG: U3 small nucleolar RNA-associated protein 13 [Icmadophila ericetorum]|nr:U3 small nucleolar RNA-associated protein 13 [Icmadophila ericetorum]
MSSKVATVITFEPQDVIQPIYTGGDVALDSEGRILVTCLGEDALLTDVNSGQLLTRVEGDGEILTALQITPSASHLITCSRSISMRIYSLQPSLEEPNIISPKLERTLKPHTTPVITAAVDQTGTLLATGGADGVIKVWDIRGGYVTHTFRGHGGVISALRFFKTLPQPKTNGAPKKKKLKSKSEDGHMQLDKDDTRQVFYLASGSEDGKIRIWDLAKRKSIATLDSHVSVVRALDFSPEKNALVSASRDKTLIIWEAITWSSKKVVPVLEVIESAGFLQGGSLIYTGGETGFLRIWDTASGREVTQEQIVDGEGNGIISVIRNLPLDSLLCVHADQSLIFHSTISLSSAGSENIIESLPILSRISGNHDEIIDLAYVTPDKSLMALATNSEDIRIISLAKPKGDDMSRGEAQYFGADVVLLQGHEDIIICLDVDWSGCWIATGAKDNTARLWRINYEENLYEHYMTFTGHAESLGAVSLPGGAPVLGSAAHSQPLDHPPSFLLTGSQDRTIKRWEVASKQSASSGKHIPRALYTRKAHDKDINAIAVNQNSSLFASASQDRTVKIWSIEEGEVQGVLRGHRRGVWSVRFAPRDVPAISSDTGSVSGSRGLVLTGSGDKTVKIWSLTDYSCLRTLEGHTNSVLKVLWMPTPQETNDAEGDLSRAPVKRSAQVVSAGGDGLVKVWDVNADECVATLDNHTDRVWSLAIHPENNTVVSGGADSVITFWKDTTSSTIAATAAASTARVEQEQQLQNYIQHRSYREAITLALQLNHPARLLSLFTTVINTYPPEPNSLSGLEAVDQVLATLVDEQLFTLLLRIRDWNTNARTAPVAQRILWVLVKSYPAARLTGLRGKGRGAGVKEVLDALKAYTERHSKRIEDLIDESYIVDYTLMEMEEVGYVEDTKVNGLLNGEEDVIMV